MKEIVVRVKFRALGVTFLERVWVLPLRVGRLLNERGVSVEVR